MESDTHLFQRLKQVFRGKLLLDEPLSEHTYFKIGGPADYYLYPKDLEDLAAVVDFCQKEGVPRFVIGNGSNLLVSDEGYRGIMIDVSETFSHLQCKGYVVTSGAGVALRRLFKYCMERGLSGFESLVGIPGQLGGAVKINAGAYGNTISEHLMNVRLLNADGTLERRSKEDITFGYRITDLPDEAILVEMQFHLTEGNPKVMEDKQAEYMARRKDQQPLSLPSAGSVFRRPPGDYAGRLIEEAGCKGLRIGDAMVSKKHANFIVNCHLASALDVRRLMDEIRQRVMDQFDVMLEPEVILVGFEN